jgi:hypothetical protein
MKIRDIAVALGKGLVAGAIGTAAMTLSSTAEARLRKREPSTVPAAAARKLLGLEPLEPEAAGKLSTVVHWGYGTSWGTVRGVFAMLGMSGPVAAVAHFTAVWGSELVMLPALDVVPPIRKWSRKDLAIDIVHHLVYVTATNVAYTTLNRAHHHHRPRRAGARARRP